MPKFPVNQKQKNVKQSNTVSAKIDKTPRTKLSPISFPTQEGDLGILRAGNPNIPRMTKAPSKTGDGISHAMGNIMKKAGMLG